VLSFGSLTDQPPGPSAYQVPPGRLGMTAVEDAGDGRVADRMSLMSDAMHYLERKCIKKVLCELTEALLVDQPEDPASYIIDVLKGGWPSPNSPILPLDRRRETASTAASTAAASPTTPRGNANCSDIASRAMSVSSSFLEEFDDLAMSSMVSRLLQSAAQSTNARIDFYATPKASSINGCSTFRLVTSSLSTAPVGEAAQQPNIVTALRSAMEQDVYGNRSLAAAAVRTTIGLEGILLLQDLAGPSDCGAFSLLPSLQLWCRVLGERLNGVVWRKRAEACKQSLEALRVGMERLVDNVKHADMGGVMDGIIPSNLLKDCVDSYDTVGLWVYNPAFRDLVLEVSGDDDLKEVRSEMVAGKSMVKEALARQQIICSRDVEGDPRSKGNLCVPIESLAVVQVGVPQLDWYSITTAEFLKYSPLSDLLRVRACMLQLVQTERQLEALERLLVDLGQSTTVAEVVRVVERDVPGVLGCDKCTLFFLDAEVDEIWAPPRAELPEGIRLALGEGIVGKVAVEAMANPNQARRSVITNDPKSLDYWKADAAVGYEVRCLMTAPIFSGKAEKRLISLIQVVNKVPGGSASGNRLRADTGTEVCTCGAIVMSDASFCWKCGEQLAHDTNQSSDTPTKKEGATFSHRDSDLLDVLAKELGQIIQHLMLDMIWTKALMDNQTPGQNDEQKPSLVSEYYRESEDPRIHTVISSVDSVFFSRQDFLEGTGAFAQDDTNLPGALQTLLSEKGCLQRTKEDPEAPVGPPQGDGFPDASNWGVNYWEMSEHEEFLLLFQALQRTAVLADMNVPTEILWNFFRAVRSNYRNNPYHNFHHAMATVHYAFKFIEVTGINDELERSDCFAVLIGSLCHDLDHRGRNNAFEMMTRSELALRYNDSSPLENHHAARAFELALGGGKDATRNVFRDLSPEVYTSIRHNIISGILATDMKHHGQHVQLMSEFSMKPDKPAAQRQFLVEVVIHTADIGNPMMPSELATRWSRSVSAEFAAQADEEEKLGLPVTPFMVGLKDTKAAAKSQVGFIDFVIQPLCTSMFRCFQGLSTPKTWLEENRLVAQEIVEPASTAETPRSSLWRRKLNVQDRTNRLEGRDSSHSNS